jgi:hypothetical protein
MNQSKVCKQHLAKSIHIYGIQTLQYNETFVQW